MGVKMEEIRGIRNVSYKINTILKKKKNQNIQKKFSIIKLKLENMLDYYTMELFLIMD